MKNELKKRILILGGGFAGIQVAHDLAKKNIKNAEVILISNKSYFEYYPGLYRVVTGASPIEVCVPLVEILRKNVDVVVDTVSSVDLQNKKVATASGEIYEYDLLVIALGSQTAYFGIPGLEELSLGFKSASQAMELRHHINKLFKTHADHKAEDLVSHFHFVVVGGGPSGVEVAGDLSVFIKKLAKIYNIKQSLISLDIVEGNPRLLPMMPESVSKKIEKRLKKLGVHIMTNRRLLKEEIEEIYLAGITMKTKTVIWTAGTELAPVLRGIQGLSFAEKGQKRTLVNEYLEAKGFDRVYVLGDAADTPYAGLAQTAIYDGKFVARDIFNILSSRTRQKYNPKKVSFAIPVGDNWGALVIGRLKIYGYFAYIVRHIIDFKYFAEILSPYKLFSIFFEGWKYRKIKE